MPGGLAATRWETQFQKDEVPQDVERVRVGRAEVDLGDSKPGGAASFTIRLDKLIFKCGLADSVTDASRKVKAGAVKVGNKVEGSPHIVIASLPHELSVRVGKRIKIAVIE